MSLADAATQDHSTADKQFPGLHNDLLFLWAMVDAAAGNRYQMVRTLSASAAFDFTLHECSTDLGAPPRTVRIPGEVDLYWGNTMPGAGGYATATFHRQDEAPVIATNSDVDATVEWTTKDNVSQPHLAQLSFGGRTFDFTGTHNAAACAAALGIAWLHGTVQEVDGPVPVRSWSTMEVIQRSWSRSDTERTRATPRG